MAGGQTYKHAGMRPVNMKKILLGLVSPLALSMMMTAPAHAQRTLTNTGFEEPDVGGWGALLPNASVPGWTSDGGAIEIWNSGTHGVPSFEGGQLAEMNAYAADTLLYQEICFTNGESFDYTFSHHFRKGAPAQTAIFEIADTNSAVIQEIDSSTVSSAGWVTKSGSSIYTGPSGLQRIQFRAEGGSPAWGNLLDAIKIDLVPYFQFGGGVASGSDNEGTGGNIPALVVSGNVPTSASVTVSVIGGTATAGDYTLNSNTITIPAGNYDGLSASSLFPIDLVIIDDNIGESDETIIFELSNAVNGAIADPSCGATISQTTYTILDDDKDYSDAPTTGTSYGDASHGLATGIQLGAAVTADASGYDSANADGDVDDGVTLPTFTQGATATIPVNVSGAGGYLQAWIDWDGDNDFADPNDPIAINVQDGGIGDTDGTADGVITLSVNVPPNATLSQTFGRFRWSTTQNLDSTTTAPDGEVEDYALTVQEAPLAEVDSGSAVSGTASTPVSNVTSNDEIGGGPVTLGSGGNATISEVGTWPSGFSLDVATGAVNMDGSVEPGTYTMDYQLCDTNSPANCETATITIVVGAEADFSITKTNTPGVNGEVDQTDDTVTSGQTTTFTLVATNNGPSTVTGAVVTDTPGAGLTCTGTDTVTITGDGVPAGAFTIADLTGGGITLDTLADGQSTTLSYSCEVN